MARDAIHDAAKATLIKDGWTITADPFRMQYEEFKLFADLAAEQTSFAAERAGRKILVEIKSFTGFSFVRDRQQAIGQFAMYQDFAPIVAPGYELYIALPESVFKMKSMGNTC